MNFDDVITTIDQLLNRIGITINSNAYDGIIVKELKSSNILNSEGSSNQTHIAITGEQMNIFPYLKSDGYFGEDNIDLKKYFIEKINIILNKTNINYLTDNFDFFANEQENINTYTTIIRSKRKGQADQLQMSLLGYDDKKFIEFRKILAENTFIIFLKKERTFEYECYGIKSGDGGDILKEFNNRFYYKDYQTIIDVKKIYVDDKKTDYSEEDLANILKNNYNNEEHNKMCRVHLFGIKYASLISEKKYNVTNIIKLSEIPKTLESELRKGMALNQYIRFLDNENKVKYKINYNTGFQSKFYHNRIIFGAPGTGKSYKLNEERTELLDKYKETNYERVTFHPDYTYANFVGTYKPVPCKNKDGSDGITYEYVPGPFMRILVEAIKNSRTDNIKPYLLIIEEINRANVAAVFGDVFQLLDRDKDGVSEYPIEASEDIKKYLADELGGDLNDYKKICIPNNMFIWATMNSADQGVYPIDTAFKRRWNFDYISIDDNEKEIEGKYAILGEDGNKRKVEWNKLRKAINSYLSLINVNEDKLLGPFFISMELLDADENNEIDSVKFRDIFKGKVLMYLFEDAAKQKRNSLFKINGRTVRYSEICSAFDKDGVYIFNDEISQQFDDDKI